MSFLRISFFCLLVFCSACAGSQPLEIVDKPIIFDDERRALSLEYMKAHYGIEADEPTIDPTMVVVHWTAIPTFEGSFNAFYNTKLPSSRTTIKDGGTLNVSVPYLIDRDGTIYQLMPDTVFARHVIGLNHTAIGIENVGDGKQHPLTEAQYEANKKLIRYLADQYAIDYVIGHHEYEQFKNHSLWLEKDPNYLTEKDDPGNAFMERLRTDLQDLNLKPMPDSSSQTDIRQGIQGQVIWLEGNLMPSIREEGDPSPATQAKGVQRTVYIYELTSREEAVYEDGFFSEIQENLVKQLETDPQGYFSIPLDTGQYSLLVKEEKGLYANLFDGAGNIQPVSVYPDSVSRIEIKVDYKAVY
ncbi:N-acetylmuramoyl-L-alanine amidase [Catalinimonas niigatensis]|uniref:N-acetylmuramoyl-L-alanine amidase n=1 Tax=Catalinimonas niigatensis TaxID=1397264 RepID=UPI002666A1C8|nr:peptidoglycan recognition family protein [Catalinimonas niigatensis]WPP50124.1 peptidoglycan recognition family protein [Catalinimonas niigatensis]